MGAGGSGGRQDTQAAERRQSRCAEGCAARSPGRGATAPVPQQQEGGLAGAWGASPGGGVMVFTGPVIDVARWVQVGSAVTRSCTLLRCRPSDAAVPLGLVTGCHRSFFPVTRATRISQQPGSMRHNAGLAAAGTVLCTTSRDSCALLLEACAPGWTPPPVSGPLW